MFFKPLAFIIALALGVAARLPEGVYRITNLQSHSTVQVRYAGGPVFVSSTRENPGPFELWQLKNAKDGGYTLDNVGLNVILMLDTSAAVKVPKNHEPVVTSRNSTVFDIEAAGGNTYVVKLQDNNLLWNVEHPVVPRGDIKLRTADGAATEHFTFALVQWPPVGNN